MTDLSAEYKALADYRPTNKVRFVTAASLFDGHDASINIMRRILQAQGAEVIHLGHNRSVDEVVDRRARRRTCRASRSAPTRAATSSTSSTWSTCCASAAPAHIKVFGGGGGVIVPERSRELHALRRRAHLLAPRTASASAWPGMINDDGRATATSTCRPTRRRRRRRRSSPATGARSPALITGARGRRRSTTTLRERAARRGRAPSVPVLGITGTGGAGKSSLTDELVRRLRLDQDDKLRIAVIVVDPTRRKSGGALLGDRIRMNAIDAPAASSPLARHARRRQRGLRRAAATSIAACKAAGFDLVIVETPGIGQGDAAIVPLVDVLALRDDARVRRRLPAREDRHARLRRRRRDQQVRAPRRRGRAARRRQAGAAQPRGVRQAARRDAGLRHAWRAASTTTASPRSTRRCCRAWPSTA